MKILNLLSHYRKTSAAIGIAVGLIAAFEGYESGVYKDTGGVLTVCYGHTGSELRMGQTYTQQECYEFLVEDLAIADAAITRLVKVPIPEDRKSVV